MNSINRSNKNLTRTLFPCHYFKDKYLQKVHLQAHDIPLPEFLAVPDLASAIEVGKTFGYPFMLKNRKLAYDGKGIYLTHLHTSLQYI